MAQLWWAVGVIFAALLAMGILSNAAGAKIHLLVGVSSLPLLVVLATLYFLPGVGVWCVVVCVLWWPAPCTLFLLCLGHACYGSFSWQHGHLRMSHAAHPESVVCCTSLLVVASLGVTLLPCNLVCTPCLLGGGGGGGGGGQRAPGTWKQVVRLNLPYPPPRHTRTHAHPHTRTHPRWPGIQ